VAERYFTPEQVAAVIPRLAGIMKRVMAAYGAMETLREEMRREQHRIAMQGGAVIDAPAWQDRRQRMQQSTAEVEEALREVQALGGVPKDLGLGLVDFPHRRDGRVVNLCWKYGEQEVRFWHGLDEGYAARRPL
jgi:hypothetical protein